MRALRIALLVSRLDAAVPHIIVWQQAFICMVANPAMPTFNWRTVLLVVIFLASMAAACSRDRQPDGAAATLVPVATDSRLPQELSTAEDGYWDGGEWQGAPVVSLTAGATREATSEAELCGLPDIVQIARNHRLAHPQGGKSEIVNVVRTFGGQSTATQLVYVMVVETITDDVFQVKCREP